MWRIGFRYLKDGLGLGKVGMRDVALVMRPIARGLSVYFTRMLTTPHALLLMTDALECYCVQKIV